MTAPVYLPGRLFKATAGSTIYCVKKGTSNITTDLIDVSGSCSAGAKESIAGFSVWKGSLEGTVDSANNIIGLTNLMFGGTFTLKYEYTTGSYITATVRSPNVSINADTKADITFTIEYESTGAITIV